MRQKLELKILWKTEDCYEMENVTLLLVEEKIAAIRTAQELLIKNPELDSIRIRIDNDCLATMSTDVRLGYGFVIVQAGDGLYFIGSDNFDSKYQVETETFELEGIPTGKEIEDFVDEWGQTHDEICSELGYDDDGADEMILGDGYFWLERFQKWFPDCSSMYDELDQMIVEYLKSKYC